MDVSDVNVEAAVRAYKYKLNWLRNKGGSEPNDVPKRGRPVCEEVNVEAAVRAYKTQLDWMKRKYEERAGPIEGRKPRGRPRKVVLSE
jgi:hypothetical protein